MQTSTCSSRPGVTQITHTVEASLGEKKLTISKMKSSGLLIAHIRHIFLNLLYLVIIVTTGLKDPSKGSIKNLIIC